MSMNPVMSWVASQKRWTKATPERFRHATEQQSFSVSCRQLGCEATKEASWLAANRWWEQQEKRLEALLAPPVPQLDPLTASVKGTIDTLGPKELRRLAVQGEAAKKLLALVNAASVYGAEVPEGALPHGSDSFEITAPLPAALFNAIFSPQAGALDMASVSCVVPSKTQETTMNEATRKNAVAEMSRLVRPKQAASRERTVQGQYDNWLKLLQARVVAGRISPSRFDAYKRNCGIFVTWIKGGSDIDLMDTAKMEEFYMHLCDRIGNEEISPSYGRSIFNSARYFVSCLSDKKLIPPIGSMRTCTFDEQGDIIHFSIEEVRALLAVAEERTQLFILLGLNCGMYQNDIAELKDSEVNWQEGTITRRRSKRKKANTKGKAGYLVTYKLWPETFQLLRQYRSGEDRVILSEDGNPMVNYSLRNGNLHRYDCIGSAIGRARKKAKIAKPVKALRKTSANLLEQSLKLSGETVDYQRFAHYFLAHAASGMDERSYTKKAAGTFDDAVDWLRGQFFAS